MNDEPVLLTQSPSYARYPHYPAGSPSLPLTLHHQDLVAHLDRLKFFLATAPSRWSAPDATSASHQHPALNRFLLPSGEYVTCVLWSGLYHITGTDIVRALIFRFEVFGRPVRNIKKFEEGVFSDLRNLKPGHDACLEEPKSPFLDLLFKYQCIRTQKKQKVFYWFSVPHDRLFLDALERDLKREKMGLESTTAVVGEPASSLEYDPKRSLYEQFAARASKGSPTQLSPHTESSQATSASTSTISLPELDYDCASSMESAIEPTQEANPATQNSLARSPFFNMFAMFEGNPTYKQRRNKKTPRARRYNGASDEDGGRSTDCGRPSSDGRPSLDGGRPSLDSEALRPNLRSHTQPQTHAPFLAGQGQFGFAGDELPASVHVPRLAQQMRIRPAERQAQPMPEHVHAHAEGQTQLPAEHVCPLLSCRRVFARAEMLRDHMRTHIDENDPPVGQGEMDVDLRDDAREQSRAFLRASPEAQYVRKSPEAQFVRKSPEVQYVSEGPQFAHVLTGPGESPSYEDERSHAYAAALTQWAQPTSESSAYGTTGASLPSPGFVQGFVYGSPGTSVSSSDALPTAAPPAMSMTVSTQPYYAHAHDHVYPVSAPSHRVTFDPIYPPSSGHVSATTYTVRRPRSVTPSLPSRAIHARRPSTANEVPSSFGASTPAPTWRFHSTNYAQGRARGYRPYATPDHAYGADSASTHSSPGTSPFAVTLNSEYAPAEPAHHEYAAAPQQQQRASTQTHAHEYATAQQSPHIQAQFAHMMSLDAAGTSPIESLDLTYPDDTYESTGSALHGDGYRGSVETSVVKPQPSKYHQYTHGGTEYTSSPPSPTDGGMYRLNDVVPSHDPQLHQHYYEQVV